MSFFINVFRNMQRVQVKLRSGRVKKSTMSNSLFYMSLKIRVVGVPVVAQWLTNPTRNHEVAGSVPALAQWVNDPVLP